MYNNWLQKLTESYTQTKRELTESEMILEELNETKEYAYILEHVLNTLLEYEVINEEIIMEALDPWEHASRVRETEYQKAADAGDAGASRHSESKAAEAKRRRQARLNTVKQIKAKAETIPDDDTTPQALRLKKEKILGTPRYSAPDSRHNYHITGYNGGQADAALKAAGEMGTPGSLEGRFNSGAFSTDPVNIAKALDHATNSEYFRRPDKELIGMYAAGAEEARDEHRKRLAKLRSAIVGSSYGIRQG